MLRKVLSFLLPATRTVSATAQTNQRFDDSAANLMVVLRESPGANKQDEKLVPITKGKVRLADGREVGLDPGWFSYLGDMHIRFVFDGPSSMRGANSKDLERLGHTPEAALEVAVKNIRSGRRPQGSDGERGSRRVLSRHLPRAGSRRR